MQIRIGYELVYECPQPTPMILMLNIHFTRVSDLVIADHIIPTPGHDVYVVVEGEREVLLPAVEDVIVEINLEDGVIKAAPPEGLL